MGWGAQCAACVRRRTVRRRWLRFASIAVALALTPPALYTIVTVAARKSRPPPLASRIVELRSQLNASDVDHHALTVLRTIEETRAAGLGSPALSELYDRARTVLDRGDRRLLVDEEIDEIELLLAYANRHSDPWALHAAASLLDRRRFSADDPMWGRLQLTIEHAGFGIRGTRSDGE